LQKTLHSLIELQEIDLRLDSLRMERGDLPQIVEKLEKTIEAKEIELQQQKEELKNLQVEEKNNELELASRREQLKKYETQLYQVKTNKEYDAIAQETETTKKAIDDLENAILTAEEKIESLKLCSNPFHPAEPF